MAIKKKFPGGLKVLLSLLFTILLGTCSTCYASQPTQEELEHFFDFIKTKESNGEVKFGLSINNISSYTLAYNFLQMTSSLNYSVDNLVFCGSRYLYADPAGSATECYGFLAIANNTFSNDYDYFSIMNPAWNDYNSRVDWAVRLSLREDSQNKTSNSVTAYYIKNNGSFGTYSLIYPQKANSPSFSVTDNLLNNNMFLTTMKTASFYYSTDKGVTYIPVLNNYTGNDYYYYFPRPTPIPTATPQPTPATGVITNSSGDTTGRIDLTGIENGINQINNTISGEAQAIRDTISGETDRIISSMTTLPNLSGDFISSGDIISQIDFSLIDNNQEFTAYSNFWFNLINGLRSSLTGNKRTLDITFRGQRYVINLDDFTLQVPQELKFMLGMWSTIYFVILIVKWWKVIIDKLSSGDIDEVLQINEEERYC